MISEVVEKSFYINLDRRPDRRQEIEAEALKIGLSPKRIRAIDAEQLTTATEIITVTELACIKSHRAALAAAIVSEASVVAIFEDDAYFVENFNEKFDAYYDQVPDDWQMLYLGCNKYPAFFFDVAQNVQNVHNAYSAHAMVLKRPVLQIMYDRLARCNAPADVIYGNIQCMVPAYAFSPSLAGQRPGWSDIAKESVDYDWIYGL